MGLFSDKNKRMAKVHGVVPEALPRALERSRRESEARSAEYQRVKAITDAHAAGRHCGGDCNICRRAGRTL